MCPLIVIKDYVQAYTYKKKINVCHFQEILQQYICITRDALFLNLSGEKHTPKEKY